VNPSPLQRLLIPVTLAHLLFACLGTAILHAADPSGDLPDESPSLELHIPRQTAFLGELIPVTLELLVFDPHDLNLPQMRATGFTLSAIDQPTRSRRQIGQRTFDVFIFKTAATAAKNGQLTLGPAECTLVLRSRKTLDPADPASELIRSGIELKRVTLRSKPVPIEILSIPTEKRPPNFSGAVGQFSLSVSAKPTRVQVGDPITVTIELAGLGALDTLSLAPQPLWRPFRLYEPTSRITTSDPLRMRGIKTFEWVIVPGDTAPTELPAFQFSYFDPEDRAFHTLSHPAIPLVVDPNPNAGPASGSPAAPAGLAHIRFDLGPLRQPSIPLIAARWFLALQTIPAALWIVAMLWRRRREHIRSNPHLGRQAQFSRFLARHVEELHALSRSDQSEAFFAAAFRLLQEVLGDVLQTPAVAITEAVLDERLPALGADPSLIQDLHSLFQICNHARYAPPTNSHALRELPQQIGQLLQRLEDLKHKDLG
jgi:hypothetical protein